MTNFTNNKQLPNSKKQCLAGNKIGCLVLGGSGDLCKLPPKRNTPLTTTGLSLQIDECFKPPLQDTLLISSKLFSFCNLSNSSEKHSLCTNVTNSNVTQSNSTADKYPFDGFTEKFPLLCQIQNCLNPSNYATALLKRVKEE